MLIRPDACVAALVGILGFVAVTIASFSQPGGGKHLWDTVIGDYSDQGFIEFVTSTAIYGPVIFLVKLALFLLYLHLFGRLRWLKWLVWSGIAITGLFYIPGIFIAFILCAPRNGETWLERSMTAKCRNGLQDYGVAQGTVSVVSDFYLLIIPIPACIVSTVALGLRIIYNKSVDITWNVVTLQIMTSVTPIPLPPPLLSLPPFDIDKTRSIVEMNVGLIVACMPSAATVSKHHGGSVNSFFGSLSARLRSLTSRRVISEKSRSDGYSPGSSVDGGRHKRPKSQTYAELRIGPGGRGGFMPGPVV
ncbi:MAG: hypothetical protein Q9168_005203 [Polycauliona sp. 1 TL-2023]